MNSDNSKTLDILDFFIKLIIFSIVNICDKIISMIAFKTINLKTFSYSPVELITEYRTTETYLTNILLKNPML